MSLPDPINEPTPISSDITVEATLLSILKERWSLQIFMGLVFPGDGRNEVARYTVRALSPEGENPKFPMHNYEVVSVAPTLSEAIAAIPQKMVEVLRQ